MLKIFSASVSILLILIIHSVCATPRLIFAMHDSTIGSALGALRIPLDQIPPYSSDLNFLLYQNDQKEYEVRIIYNNKEVHPPACQSNPCALPEFEQLIKRFNKTYNAPLPPCLG